LFAAAVLITTLLAGSGLATAAGGQAPDGKKATRSTIAKYCGSLTKTAVAQSNASQSTSSGWTDVTGSNLTLTVGPGSPDCVIVSFSAQAYAPASGSRVMFVRAFLDDILSVDGEIQLAAQSVAFAEAHAYNFLFPSVPPGAHEFKMQYRPLVLGNQVFINDFDLSIRHR
jgi:hypothetical protein